MVLEESGTVVHRLTSLPAPKEPGSEVLKRQGHPFFCPGNRSCLISTVHHYGLSLLSIYKMKTDEFNQT
jgi:hypothetical protein